MAGVKELVKTGLKLITIGPIVQVGAMIAKGTKGAAATPEAKVFKKAAEVVSDGQKKLINWSVNSLWNSFGL